MMPIRMPMIGIVCAGMSVRTKMTAQMPHGLTMSGTRSRTSAAAGTGAGAGPAAGFLRVGRQDHAQRDHEEEDAAGDGEGTDHDVPLYEHGASDESGDQDGERRDAGALERDLAQFAFGPARREFRERTDEAQRPEHDEEEREDVLQAERNRALYGCHTVSPISKSTCMAWIVPSNGNGRRSK